MLTSRIDEGTGYPNIRDFIQRGVRQAVDRTPKQDASPTLDWSFLDLFSTSQTFSSKTAKLDLTCASEICINNAPYFAFQKHDRTYGVVQGCCNSWNCPRCGLHRAKTEYGRIVEGCRILSEQHDLWFITITCRGKEMSREQAIDGYLGWANRLLTCWRQYAARHNQKWCYAAVTEHQKRGHPHSHILTTFTPPDIRKGYKTKWEIDGKMERNSVQKEALLSDYVHASCIRAGLGSQYDISRVQNSEAASRYVAKYLFKNTIFSERWPKGWKRVRYSREFPKLPARSTNAFILLTHDDWRRLARLAVIVTTDCGETKDIVLHELRGGDVIVN
jgi:hypothetical protein